MQSHRKNNNMNQPDPPELQGLKNHRVLKEGNMAPASYVAENGLVEQQWEKRILVL